MGISAFNNEARRFLASADPDVLCVSGGWGAGKTFAWNLLLKEARGKGGIKLKRYAYVSLFGLGSLDEIRRAIFENTVPSEIAGDAPDFRSLEAGMKSLRSWRAGTWLLRNFGPASSYVGILDKVSILMTKEQVVCIDDLERKNRAVDVRDILGLISQLKEQRGCKIVILLNDGKFSAEERDEFRKQLEKVADTSIRFEPTPFEAAEIGTDPAHSFRDQLREHCANLEILNIRTIKRIERVALRLEEELRDFDPRVLSQAIHSASLFCFSKHQSDVAPTMDFLRAYNPWDAANAEARVDLPHPVWRALLTKYGFGHMDDFDLAVFEGVRDGHFDAEALKREARILATRLALNDDDRSFSEAWDLAGGSFDDNAEQVAEQLAQAVTRTPLVISPLNLSNTISLLKDIGWPGDVAELIQTYVAARQDGPEFWNLAASAFGDEVRDEHVRAAFAAKFSTFAEQRDTTQVLISIGRDRWNSRDLAFLAERNEDEFLAAFRSTQGMDFRYCVQGSLSFRNTINATDEMKTISAKAESALQTIAAESPINRRRVRQYGVTLPQEA